MKIVAALVAFTFSFVILPNPAHASTGRPIASYQHCEKKIKKAEYRLGKKSFRTDIVICKK